MATRVETPDSHSSFSTEVSEAMQLPRGMNTNRLVGLLIAALIFSLVCSRVLKTLTPFLVYLAAFAVIITLGTVLECVGFVRHSVKRGRRVEALLTFVSYACWIPLCGSLCYLTIGLLLGKNPTDAVSRRIGVAVWIGVAIWLITLVSLVGAVFVRLGIVAVRDRVHKRRYAAATACLLLYASGFLFCATLDFFVLKMFLRR